MYSIITSLLNNDLYKVSMMNFVATMFPKTEVEYRFKNRGSQRFTPEFLEKLKIQINWLNSTYLSDEEYEWMKKTFPFLSPSFLAYFKNFKFNPSNISIKLTEDNNLDLTIKGKWIDTILFEVPLLAIISELYFTTVDTQWSEKRQDHINNAEYIIERNIPEQIRRAREKAQILSDNKCLFTDFGTRRRRSHLVQNSVIQAFVDFSYRNPDSTFLGTSNLYFAKKYDIKCFGSIAHEVIQATQVLNSYNHCNYYAMENWMKVYSDVEIGTALTDTVGVDAFLKDFNRKLSMLYPSVRHDSGDPFLFTDKIINHYKKMKIDPKEKTIIFSDNLNVEKVIQINRYCENKIKCSFGIGTFFTNDFLDSPSLNMVIKLYSVNGFPVVKLSDVEGKETGDQKAVEFMKWIVKNQLGI